MAKKKQRTSDSALRQAQLEANVQFAPEQRGLAELLSQAHSDLKSGLAGEKSAATGIIGAAQAAKPEIAAIYKSAGRSQSEAKAALQSDLSSLGAGADPYKAVSAREFAGAQGRLAEAMAAAHQDLTSRQVSAKEGQAFGQARQRADYRATKGKLAARSQGIQQEKGQLAAATYEKLVAAQQAADAEQANRDRQFALQSAQLAETARGHDLSAQTSAATRAQSAYEAKKGRQVAIRGQNISAAKNGKKPLSASEQRARRNESNKVIGQIKTAQALIQDAPARLPSSQVKSFLRTGQNPSKLKFDEDVINSAFDLHGLGALTPQSTHNLLKRGVSVPKPWRTRRGTTSPANIGAALGAALGSR